MLRLIRQRLRRIRYYSARRPRSGWGRAMDIALFAAFLLSLPAAWVADIAIVRERPVAAYTGRLVLDADGQVFAYFLEESNGGQRWRGGWMGSRLGEAAGEAAEAAPTGGWTDARPYGTFALREIEQHRGWPWSSTVDVPPVRVDVRLFSEPEQRTATTLPGDSPVRGAIRAALDAEPPVIGGSAAGEPLDAEQLAASFAGARFTSRSWATVGVNGLAWWVGLYVLAAMCIGAIRLISFMGVGHRATREARRRSDGCCIHCGYDLRGLEFAERCPECGELTA